MKKKDKPKPADFELIPDSNLGKTKKSNFESNSKREFLAYKYSNRGRDDLDEAIIVGGLSRFVSWKPDTDTGYVLKPNIDEPTRIIRPPSAEEYPYTPYEFKDESELAEYFKRASSTNLTELYKKNKSFYKKYVDQDENIIVMLSTDSIATWFQDLMDTIHYSEGIGGNDAGKSSIGYTFEYTGYRVVKGTDISAANYARIMGSIEPGQCVIIEDEADSVSQNPDKVRILKSGYEYNAKTPKTNMNTKNQETNWFYPYGYKMLLSEKSLSEYKAKGLVDRTWTYQCRPGNVKIRIKKVVSETINKSPHLQKLYEELLDFRKLMLCYRLIHYKDELPQIKISLTNRDEELSYSFLQLFYKEKEIFGEIKNAIGFFLKQRRRRRGRSLEAAVYPILKDLITELTNFTSDNPNLVNIPYSKIWEKIISGMSIKGNLLNDHQYETRDYNIIYQNTFSRFIADKFSGDLRPSKNGSILSFDRIKFDNYDVLYNHKAKEEDPDINIQVSLDLGEGEKIEHSTSQSGEGSEGSEGSSKGYHDFNGKNEAEKQEKNNETHPPEPSQPSPPSPKVKCPKCNENLDSDPYWSKHHKCEVS